MEKSSVVSKAKENSPPPQQAGGESPREEEAEYRGWTQFELNAVFALVCRHEHLKMCRGKRDFKGFAAKLNAALKYHDYSHREPIQAEDAEAVIRHLYTRRKGAMRFVERQSGPLCLTRKQKHILMRQLGFDGTKVEWIVQGRGKRVTAERAARRAGGSERTIITSGGLKVNRYVPHYAQETGRRVPERRPVDGNDVRPRPGGVGYDQRRNAEERDAVRYPCLIGPYDNGWYLPTKPTAAAHPQHDAQASQLLAIIKDADRPAPKAQKKGCRPGDRAPPHPSPPVPSAQSEMPASPEYCGPRPATPVPADSHWADVIQQARQTIHPSGPLPTTSPMPYPHPHPRGVASPLPYYHRQDERTAAPLPPPPPPSAAAMFYRPVASPPPASVGAPREKLFQGAAQGPGGGVAGFQPFLLRRHPGRDGGDNGNGFARQYGQRRY